MRAITMDIVPRKFIEIYSKLAEKLSISKTKNALISLIAMLIGGILSQLSMKFLSDYSTKLEDLDRDLKREDEDIDTLTKQSEQNEDTLAKRKEEYDNLNKELEKLQGGENDYKADISQLQQDLNSLSDERALLKEKNDELLQDSKNNKLVIADIEAEIKQENTDMLDRRSQSRQMHVKKNDDIKDIETRLAKFSGNKNGITHHGQDIERIN